MLDSLIGLAFLLAALCTWRLVAAGRRQLRGQLEEGRARSRGPAFGAATACAALALLLVSRGLLGLTAAAAASGAGICALLGGLSGKPVPAAWFSAALLAVALIASLLLLTAC